MSDPIDRDEQRTAAALFKYTLILPLLRGEYPPGGKGRLREQIAAGRYEIPNSSRNRVSVPSLARWERIYRSEGFEGLKPKPRSDRGQLRVPLTRDPGPGRNSETGAATALGPDPHHHPQPGPDQSHP